jgi:hypothetical protein
MSKLAERLRVISNRMTDKLPLFGVHDTCNEAADALDACERALRQYADTYCELGHAAEACGKPADTECGGCLARKTLAKLEAAR